MEKLQMFEYKANSNEIEKIRNSITFTDLQYYDESLTLALVSGKTFEQWAFQHFGFNYNKSALAIAVCLDLILINGGINNERS